MDSITQQFIDLLLKLEGAISHLRDAIHEHKSVMENSAHAENKEQVPPPQVNAELHLSKGIEDAIAKKGNEGQGWQKANVVVNASTALFTALAFAAAAWYACIASGQLKQMRIATKASEAASRTAVWALEENQAQFKKTLQQIKIQTQAQLISATAAKESSGTASKELIASQRPWFGISRFEVLQYDPAHPEIPFRIEVFFKNTGKTPALRVKIAGMFNIHPPVNHLPIAAPTNEDWKFFDSFFANYKGSYVAAPDAERGEIATDYVENIVAKNYASINNLSQFVYYFGKAVYYESGNSRPHTTTFCLYLAEPKTKQLAHCENGNDMD